MANVLAATVTSSTISRANDPDLSPETTEPPSPKTIFLQSRPRPDVNPGIRKITVRSPVERAHEAFQASRFSEAEALYLQALQSDRALLDALLGMATLAARLHRIAEALAWYQRVLEADPDNPSALGAVTNITLSKDSGQAESRLKNAIAKQPSASTLSFALGNLYARQGHWAEAQRAYFTALSEERTQPDYLFNLAVSLDHLHQNALAAQYYEKALTAAQRVDSASFDESQARSRLIELRR